METHEHLSMLKFFNLPIIFLLVSLFSNIKKSLAQEVRQKSDILEHRSKGWGKVRPLQSLLCLQYHHWVTMRLVLGPVIQKINITFLSINNLKKKRRNTNNGKSQLV